MAAQFDTTELNQAIGAQLPAYLTWTGRTPVRSGRGYRLKDCPAHYFDPGGWHKAHNSGDGGDLISDYQTLTGRSFKDAAQDLAEWTGAGRADFTPCPDRQKALADQARDREALEKADQAKKHRHACEIWEAAAPVMGLPETHVARRYLHFRGLPASFADMLSDDVRFADVWGKPHVAAAIRCPHFDTRTRDWNLLGVHLTQIAPDGSNAKDERGRSIRFQYGTSGQSVERVIFPTWRAEPPTLLDHGRLGVSEGLEDAWHLSLTSDAAPVWATLDAGTMAKLTPVQGIESLEINADSDQAGQQAAAALADTWTAHGIPAEIFTPTTKDFADALAA